MASRLARTRDSIIVGTDGSCSDLFAVLGTTVNHVRWALREARTVKGKTRSRLDLKVQIIRNTSPEAQERVAEVLRMLLNPPARFLKREDEKPGA